MKRSKTPTFLLELPLRVDSQQAKHLRAHFEAARCLYNALLGEAMKRLKQMRADERWQQARSIPKVHKQERSALFSELRQEYGFSEYALHAYALIAIPHRSSRPVPIKPPIASAWAKPRKFASRAVVVAWTVSRARPISKAFTLSCTTPPKAMRAF